jgi:hypothetical protein
MVTPQLGSGTDGGGVETGMVVPVVPETTVVVVVVSGMVVSGMVVSGMVVSGMVPVTGGVLDTAPEPAELPAAPADDEAPVEAEPETIGPSSIGATAQAALKARTVTGPLVRVNRGCSTAPPIRSYGR